MSAPEISIYFLESPPTIVYRLNGDIFDAVTLNQITGHISDMRYVGFLDSEIISRFTSQPVLIVLQQDYLIIDSNDSQLRFIQSSAAPQDLLDQIVIQILQLTVPNLRSISFNFSGQQLPTLSLPQFNEHLLTYLNEVTSLNITRLRDLSRVAQLLIQGQVNLSDPSINTYPISQIIQSGSRGAPHGQGQISGLIGQSRIQSRRVVSGTSSRVLPIIEPNTNIPEFNLDVFTQGLTSDSPRITELRINPIRESYELLLSRLYELPVDEKNYIIRNSQRIPLVPFSELGDKQIQSFEIDPLLQIWTTLPNLIITLFLTDGSIIAVKGQYDRLRNQIFPPI